MSHNTHLERTLGLRSLVMFGLAYMTPIIVLGIFGIVASASGGASASSYLIALLAMTFTAWSYGRLAKAYPVAGSAYTYVRKTIDSRVGFLVGWSVLLDYLFLPMVIWLFGAVYLEAQFPGVPGWVWIVGFIAITTVLNILGMKIADKTNFVLMAFQAIVLLIFVVLSIISVTGGAGTGTIVSSSPFVGDHATFSQVVSGAAIAAYCFLGFDAVTTFTEDTINPQHNIPRAIMWVAGLGGFIFVLVSYTTQLVHPGGTFNDSASAAFEIAGAIGGNVFSAIFVGGLVIGQFTSGLAAQASASRLLYAMGRDGVLPKRVFGAIADKFKTPMVNLIIIGIVGLASLMLDAATSTSFINFGAFTAFTMVNISLISHYLRESKKGNKLNVFSNVIAPIIGAVVCAYLLTQLDSNALTLGLYWLGAGAVILAVITKGFTRRPPELVFED